MNTLIMWSSGALGLAALALSAVADDPTEWGKWGLAGVVIAMTFYRDQKREERMSASLDEHSRWVQDVYAREQEVSAKSREALTNTLARLTEKIENCHTDDAPALPAQRGSGRARMILVEEAPHDKSCNG